MNRAITLLASAGLGAGLMFFLDPRGGRRRRAVVRDKTIRMVHKTRDAAEVVRRDLRNRAYGLACGDFSVLIGGRRALHRPWRGSWSPTGRALLTMLGSGLFLTGLTRRAPQACVMGAAGLALIAEGITNAGIEDIAHLPANVGHATSTLVERMAMRRHASGDGRAQQLPRSSAARG